MKFDKYDWFDSIEACVSVAAPRFIAKRWRWTRCGIPDAEQIRQTLYSLRQARSSSVSELVGTGRLYMQRIGDDVKYGVEKAPKRKARKEKANE